MRIFALQLFSGYDRAQISNYKAELARSGGGTHLGCKASHLSRPELAGPERRSPAINA